MVYSGTGCDDPDRLQIEEYARRGYPHESMRTSLCRWPRQPVVDSIARWVSSNGDE